MLISSLKKFLLIRLINILFFCVDSYLIYPYLYQVHCIHLHPLGYLPGKTCRHKNYNYEADIINGYK